MLAVASWYKIADEVSVLTSVFQAAKWEKGVRPAKMSFGSVKQKLSQKPLADFHLSLLATLNIRESEETAL